MTDERVREIIYQVCEACGFPEIAPQIRYEWSNRMTSTKGRVWYTRKFIKFSKPIFDLDTEEGNENTVAHEVCHIIAYTRYPKCKPHGVEWQTAMIMAGYKPERCHNVDCASLKRPGTRFSYVCPECSKVYTVSKRQHIQILYGEARAYCRKCGAEVGLTN